VSGIFHSQRLDRTVTEMLISVVLVVGLYVFAGNSGVVSFGHIAFTAIGAYATAWQTVQPFIKGTSMPGLPTFLLKTTVPVWPAAIISGLFGALIAVVIGIAMMRLSGIAASIGTFAFMAIINSTYNNWDRVTAGTSSLIGIPVYVNKWVALIWTLIALMIAYAYQISRYGLSLQASREDESAAKAAGVNVFRQRLLAYTLSAFILAIGGVLYAHFLGTLFVNFFYLHMTFTTLAMLVVGGMNSLTGAVTGAVVLSSIVDLLRQLEKGLTLGDFTLAFPSGVQEIGLGLVMLIMLIYMRQGLTANKEVSWPFSKPLSRK
jgi:branched-chain amino acid transport system permease protein